MSEKNEIFGLIDSHHKNDKNKGNVMLRLDLVDICKGNKNAAIMLNQLIYWRDYAERTKSGWLYKSNTDWYNETRLTRSESEKAKKVLMELDFIEVIVKRAEGHPQTHYRLQANNVTSALKNLFAVENEPLHESSSESIPLHDSCNQLHDSSSTLHDSSSPLHDSCNVTENTQRILREYESENTMGASPQSPYPIPDSETSKTKNSRKEINFSDDPEVLELIDWVIKTYEVTSSEDIYWVKRFGVLDFINCKVAGQTTSLGIDELSEIWKDLIDTKLAKARRDYVSKNCKPLVGKDRIKYDRAIILKSVDEYFEKKKARELQRIFEENERKKYMPTNMEAVYRAAEWARAKEKTEEDDYSKYLEDDEI